MLHPMITKAQQKLIRSLEQKKFREREGLFVAEGPKVVGDLMEAGYEAVMTFRTPDDMTEEELQRISFLQHPQGVLAVFKKPLQASAIELQTSKLMLALDGVQDPGNLGTIIRIADWFGIDEIVCSKDTADCWAPKVVQATMGSIARVNIIFTNLNALFDTLPTDFPVYGTLLDGDNIYTQQLTTGGIIVMGNEGQGLTEEVRRRVNHRLLIPSYRTEDTAESLNVAIATAIVCAEFRRRGTVQSITP